MEIVHADRQEPSIRSVERALRLITAAVEAPDGIGLVEAARLADLAPSTATRILRTLEAARFVARRDDGAYVAGTELLRLGALQASESPLLNAAQAHLDTLAAVTGESCYLAVAVDQTWATYVRMTQSVRSVRHVSWLGRRIPRATSAVGAALAGVIDGRGVAIVKDGVEPDTTAIAIPVRDGRSIVAAINVVGPSFRMTKPAHRAIIDAAQSATEALHAAITSTRREEPLNVHDIRATAEPGAHPAALTDNRQPSSPNATRSSSTVARS